MGLFQALSSYLVLVVWLEIPAWGNYPNVLQMGRALKRISACDGLRITYRDGLTEQYNKAWVVAKSRRIVGSQHWIDAAEMLD